MVQIQLVSKFIDVNGSGTARSVCIKTAVKSAEDLDAFDPMIPVSADQLFLLLSYRLPNRLPELIQQIFIRKCIFLQTSALKRAGGSHDGLCVDRD
jgi:hypothetical protein